MYYQVHYCCCCCKYCCCYYHRQITSEIIRNITIFVAFTILVLCLSLIHQIHQILKDISLLLMLLLLLNYCCCGLKSFLLHLVFFFIHLFRPFISFLFFYSYASIYSFIDLFLLIFNPLFIHHSFIFFFLFNYSFTILLYLFTYSLIHSFIIMPCESI